MLSLSNQVTRYDAIMSFSEATWMDNKNRI